MISSSLSTFKSKRSVGFSAKEQANAAGGSCSGPQLLQGKRWNLSSRQSDLFLKSTYIMFLLAIFYWFQWSVFTVSGQDSTRCSRNDMDPWRWVRILGSAVLVAKNHNVETPRNLNKRQRNQQKRTKMAYSKTIQYDSCRSTWYKSIFVGM